MEDTAKAAEAPAATGQPAEPAEKVSGPDGANDSFAIYFAKRLVAEEGFTEGTVEEARALMDACDVLLMYTDGMRFSLVCVVDAERDPTRKFALPPEVVRGIAEACRVYCGKLFGVQLSPLIRIVEIRSRIEEADRKRLLAYRPGLRNGTHIEGAILSPQEKRAWNTRRLGLRLTLAHTRLLRAPRIPDAELFQETVEPDAQVDQPYLTYGILAMLALIFIAELVFGVAPSEALSPDVTTLVALGGLQKLAVVQNHEWYRLFTAPLLHGGVLHLLFNGYALLVGGLFLEFSLGRAWLLATFVVGGLGGALMSMRINSPETVSIGASGAIMGLVTAAYVISRRLPRGALRRKVQIPLLQVLIPSLLALGFHSGEEVDYAAHFGGALAGLAVGLVLLLTWKKQSGQPRFAWAGRVIAAAGVLAAVIGFAEARAHYQPYTLERLLIPAKLFEGEESDVDQAIEAQSQKLVADYPRDPRGHLFRAIQLIHASKMNEPPRRQAEAELAGALADPAMLERMVARYNNHSIEEQLRICWSS